KIQDAYEKFIKPTLQKDEDELFRKTFLKIVMILSKKVLINALIKECPFYLSWVSANQDAWESFIKETCPEQDPRTLHPNQHRITILTTSASGGNSAVTRALQKWFDAQKVPTQVIDVEESAEQNDAMKLATGSTYDRMYDLYFQKQDAGTDFLTQRDLFNRRL